MGTIVEFPADAASRTSASRNAADPETMGRLVILPVIRIERHDGKPSGDHDPEQGTTNGRRRRRRARS